MNILKKIFKRKQKIEVKSYSKEYVNLKARCQKGDWNFKTFESLMDVVVLNNDELTKKIDGNNFINYVNDIFSNHANGWLCGKFIYWTDSQGTHNKGAKIDYLAMPTREQRNINTSRLSSTEQVINAFIVKKWLQPTMDVKDEDKTVLYFKEKIKDETNDDYEYQYYFIHIDENNEIILTYQ